MRVLVVPSWLLRATVDSDSKPVAISPQLLKLLSHGLFQILTTLDLHNPPTSYVSAVAGCGDADDSDEVAYN